MKTLDIGELVNSNYSRDEVIAYLNTQLIEITKNLVKDSNQNSWSGVGASVNQLGELSCILQVLNEKVNGKKEPMVL